MKTFSNALYTYNRISSKEAKEKYLNGGNVYMFKSNVMPLQDELSYGSLMLSDRNFEELVFWFASLNCKCNIDKVHFYTRTEK